MNRSAVLHIPVSQYAFALDEQTMTIRLRTGKDDIEECDIFWGDRACGVSPVSFTRTPMNVRWQDARFDFYEVTLQRIPRRLCYYFRIKKGSEWWYYYADQFFKRLPDIVMEDGFVIEGRSEYYQYPYILRSEIPAIPEWFQNAVVYNIFPDSFASACGRIAGQRREIEDDFGNVHTARLGGTIRGIIENLEEIRELGFNCIYLNPICGALEYHKYDSIDYFHVDPCLGTDEDFMELTDKVHEMGMRIIIDGVFNHCGWRHPFFLDVVREGEGSVYKDWFYELQFPVTLPEEDETPSYACFAYEKKMPKLNTANPQVQKYFARVGAYWIEKFHVDGWRLDVANEINKSFWRAFRQAVKEASQDAVLIGEVWENSEDWLSCDLLDSTMNYDFRRYCRMLFGQKECSAEDFLHYMTDMLLRYPSQFMRAQLNLLDSHDVARFLSLCGGNVAVWKQAFLCLMLFPGVPSMFYGDEREMKGVREEEYRSPMAWDNACEETRRFVREVIKIRREQVPVDADWIPVWEKEHPGLLVFERKKGHTVRVVLNTEEKSVDVAKYAAEGTFLLAEGMSGRNMEGGGFLVVKTE